MRTTLTMLALCTFAFALYASVTLLDLYLDGENYGFMGVCAIAVLTGVTATATLLQWRGRV